MEYIVPLVLIVFIVLALWKLGFFDPVAKPEEVNKIFNDLTYLANGNRTLVWNIIAGLRAEKKRTPTLGEVVDRLVNGT
jgi:hypothetical protein